MGIEAKYQAVILARSNGRRGGGARAGGGDNSYQLLCFCQNESALAALDEGGGGGEREGKEEQDAVAVDPSGVERWEGVQLPGRPRPQNIEMSGTSSE